MRNAIPMAKLGSSGRFLIHGFALLSAWQGEPRVSAHVVQGPGESASAKKK